MLFAENFMVVPTLYLGVTLLSEPQFKIDTDVIRRKFYGSANTVLANSFHQDDIVRLHLVESYCLPVIQYCCPAIKLNNAQINEINICWNTMYRRIFRFHKWESVKTFICGLGRLYFKHLCNGSFEIPKIFIFHRYFSFFYVFLKSMHFNLKCTHYITNM